MKLLVKAILFWAILFYLLPAEISAQVGFGLEVFPGPTTDKKETKKENKVANSTVSYIAAHFQVDNKEVEDLFERGFGYGELVRVFLIAQKANRPVKDVAKRRETEDTFKKICDRYKLDFWEIDAQAEIIQEEIKKNISAWTQP